MKKRVGLTIAIVVTVIAVCYFAFALFFQSHFCFGTSIDGIPVGGRSVAKVEELIREEIEGYVLKLVEREDETETISGNSVGIAPVFQGEVEELLEAQNGFAWPCTLFKKEELQLEKMVSFDEDALKKVIKELSCMQKENQRKPVDASCSEYNEKEGYTLVLADYGTTMDEEKLVEAVSDAILILAEEVDLSEENCYVDPDVGDDDKELLALIEELNRYVGTTITYEFGTKSEVLDGKTISTWLSEDHGKVSVDEEAVLSYVKELGRTYNTAYKPKEFETSYGKTVTISTGFYGWRIDNAGEVAQILEDLKAGEAVEREPVYAQTANSHEGNDYGDSYVEINLTAQHLFLYKEGKLVVDSDFVSGCVSKGHSTPTGAFGVTYTTTNAVLRGEDYETPVNYWMPFNGDVGMHDATWRRSFGGNIYKTGGSHGCINLPLSAAKKIYETIDKGYAVLVYTLPGTESKAVQQQDAATVVNLINSIGTVTLESETVINNARNLYNALPDSAKAYVTNIDVLTAAEAALAQLKAGEQPVQETPQEQQPEDQSQEQQPTDPQQEQQPGDQQQEQQPTDPQQEQQPTE